MYGGRSLPRATSPTLQLVSRGEGATKAYTFHPHHLQLTMENWLREEQYALLFFPFQPPRSHDSSTQAIDGAHGLSAHMHQFHPYDPRLALGEGLFPWLRFLRPEGARVSRALD